MQLPRDEAPHNQPVEWWYFSGHLDGVGSAGRPHCYGFEFVIFQFPGLLTHMYYGDFAVTDLTRGTFQYKEQESSYLVPTTVDRFALHAGAWTMSGGSGHDQLRANLPGYSLDLTLKATEPPVLEGPGGVVHLGPVGKSDYYSWTSLASTGTMVDHGTRVTVKGVSWMDHQWGPINVTGGAGWDWFSVQLQDHHQYMLFFIRSVKGQIIESFGTTAGPGGHVRYLPAQDLSEQATGSWKSPASGITYGSGWRLKLPGGQLVVTPDIVNQELDLVKTQGVVYWEGDVTIGGELSGHAVHGVGYTELNPPHVA